MGERRRRRTLGPTFPAVVAFQESAFSSVLLQEIYVEALQSYVMTKRKCEEHMVAFAKLLSVLTELRSLGNSNAKTCFELRMINRKLPAFLAEIWDIK